MRGCQSSGSGFNRRENFRGDLLLRDCEARALGLKCSWNQERIRGQRDSVASLSPYPLLLRYNRNIFGSPWILREAGINIPRYLYSSLLFELVWIGFTSYFLLVLVPLTVRNGKRDYKKSGLWKEKCWIMNLLLDSLVCSPACCTFLLVICILTQSPYGLAKILHDSWKYPAILHTKPSNKRYILTVLVNQNKEMNKSTELVGDTFIVYDYHQHDPIRFSRLQIRQTTNEEFWKLLSLIPCNVILNVYNDRSAWDWKNGKIAMAPSQPWERIKECRFSRLKDKRTFAASVSFMISRKMILCAGKRFTTFV